MAVHYAIRGAPNRFADIVVLYDQTRISKWSGNLCYKAIYRNHQDVTNEQWLAESVIRKLLDYGIWIPTTLAVPKGA